MNLFLFQVLSQSLLTLNTKRSHASCSTGKFLVLIMVFGLTCLMLVSKGPIDSVPNEQVTGEKGKVTFVGGLRLGKLLRRPPRIPPRLSPDEGRGIGNRSANESKIPNTDPKWTARQQRVKEAFIHAWSGYKNFAMGYDELMPVSQHGVDGLGGLGASVVDALDTAMIMGLDNIVSEAGSWVETHLLERIRKKGQVNLFETTIRVLGGLLSAYQLRGGEQGMNLTHSGPKPVVYLDVAKDLADRLLSAFTSSPTPVPFSDVVLHDSSAHPAPGGLSSTAEISTLQLEFNYLSAISGDPKYSIEAMKVLAHIKTLPKTEGLVPIYIRSASRQLDTCYSLS